MEFTDQMGNIRFTGQTQYPTRSQVGNVKVLVNCGGGELKELLKSISIVWSFTGGVNSRKNSNPADAEHFGIAVVEALSAGNVQRPNLCAEFKVIRAGKWLLGIFRQAKKSSNFILDRISKKTEKIGFGGPGGGPLDPDRDLVPIPGGFRSGAPTATRIKPKIVFRTITKNKVLKFG